MEPAVILEVALLDVKPNQEAQFEKAFAQAQHIIASMPGYLSHQLQRCLEQGNRYLCWCIGRVWKIIPSDFAPRLNTKNGRHCYTIFTIRFLQFTILRQFLRMD